MKIKKLEKNELGNYEVLDLIEKVNEIIDFLNSSFLTLDPDEPYGEVTATTTLLSLDPDSARCCPHCGTRNNYSVGEKRSVTSVDSLTYEQRFNCHECGKDWTETK